MVQFSKSPQWSSSFFFKTPSSSPQTEKGVKTNKQSIFLFSRFNNTNEQQQEERKKMNMIVPSSSPSSSPNSKKEQKLFVHPKHNNSIFSFGGTNTNNESNSSSFKMFQFTSLHTERCCPPNENDDTPNEKTKTTTEQQIPLLPTSTAPHASIITNKERHGSNISTNNNNNNDDEVAIVGRTLYEMANAQSQLGHTNTALHYLNQALKAQRNAYGEEHTIVAQTLVRRSVLLAQSKHAYYSLLDKEKAARINKRIGREVEEEKEILKEEATTLFKVGTLQQERGNYDEALDNFYASLQIQRRIMGNQSYSSSVEVAKLLCIIGKAHHQRREHINAIDAFAKGIAIYKKVGCDVKKQHSDDSSMPGWVVKCIKDKTLFAVVNKDYWSDPNGV